MIRRFAAVALSTALIVTVLSPSAAVAVSSAPIPSTMAALGDSITRAASSDGNLGADAPHNSWSTGTSTTVNSHYLRLRAELSPDLAAHNLSVSGAKVGNCGTANPCFRDQIGSVLNLATEPDYVTVLIGGNDLCTDTVESMTSVELFKSEFSAAMTALMDGTSDTHVYVVSIPDVWQLWNLFKNNFWARFVWNSAKICQSLLANPTSTKTADVERREEVQRRNAAYNAAMKDVCESTAIASRCLFDQNAVFGFTFGTNDVSGDYFHPSVEGQRKLSDVSWRAGYQWDSSQSENQAPAASFTHVCTDLACSFTDGSTDSDGSIASWSWNFGDGATSSAENPSHTYGAGGDYIVTLTVTDDGGTPASTSKTVSVSAGTDPPPNADPAAAFTASCTDLSCAFTDGSTDGDGSILAWSWTFGDGGTSTEQSPSHVYAAGGTYSVSLTVTDDGGGTDTSSQSVTVSAPSNSISLSASASKVKGTKTADLSWSGATSTSVDIVRDGSVVETVANDGAHTDIIGKGGGTHIYQVCEAGTTTCSPEVTVSY